MKDKDSVWKSRGQVMRLKIPLSANFYVYISPGFNLVLLDYFNVTFLAEETQTHN